MPHDVASRFAGTVTVIAPHMDDEALACGGLIAKLPDKSTVHVIYATDGMKSPAPVMPWRDRISDDLGQLRMEESTRATGMLGVPRENLHFMGLPEAELQAHLPTLTKRLLELLDELRPQHVLVPFRYDRHPDHLAINRVVSEAVLSGRCVATITEYFVYYRSRLLPRRDVRKYIRRPLLVEIPIEEVAALKRAALDCFKTQTTRFYPWQTRPILTPELLDEECIGPEMFLRADSAMSGPAIFATASTWIRLAHRLEPRLQKWKYLVKSTLVRCLGRSANGSA
jgi:LmbE family N-acetylglucosaminyl deacetylase